MDEVITFKHQTLSHFISHCKYSLSPFTGKKWHPLPPPPQKAPQPDHPTEKPPLPIFFGGQKPPAENPPLKIVRNLQRNLHAARRLQLYHHRELRRRWGAFREISPSRGGACTGM